jgi:M6 family metalloprotease-like protein
MNRRIASLVGISLALALLPSIAQAATKPGAKCAKVGATSLSVGKKFTCIKSGAKLVWNKGVAVKSPSAPTPPKPSATSTPSVTPSANPTPATDATALCKLPVADGRGDVAIGAWPRISSRMKSVGTVTAQIIMVDFPDAPATISPEAAFAKISPASDIFAEVSYGKLTYSMHPTFKWYRMSKNSTEYTSGGWTFNAHRNYILEALKLADADVDFSHSQSFIVLANPDAKGLGYSGPAFAASSGNGVTFDNTLLTNGATSAADLNGWGPIWANHELTHTLGLVDLYTYDSKSHNGNGFPFTGEFSYMGLSSSKSNSPGLLAFERWNLGWLDDSQIICSSATSAKQLITPIETKGGVKALIVPISKTKAVVVESRRPIGMDAGLKKSGALVYVVDSSIQSGLGPVRVYPASDADPRFLQAPRALGESVTIEGVTVTVTATSDAGDTVKVTR